MVRRFQRGDDSALGEIYTEHQPRLSLFLRGLLGDADAADDAVQEVFERARRNLLKFDVELGRPLSAWLHVVARTVAIDELRRRARTRPWDPATFADFSDGALHSRDPHSELTSGSWAFRELMSLLRTLPPRQREAFTLVTVLGYTHAEAAAAMGESQANVRQLKARGLRRLRLSSVAPLLKPE